MKQIYLYEPDDIIMGNEYIRDIKVRHIENIPHLKWSPIKQNIGPVWKGKKASTLLEMGNEIISGDLPISSINFGKDFETERLWDYLDSFLEKYKDEADFSEFKKGEFKSSYFVATAKDGMISNGEIVFTFENKIITDWYYL
jgi:hypothetical protein